MNLTANHIRIEVEDLGPRDAPAVLLIMGLGMQLIAWPEYFVQPLLDAGFRVIRFDNRDIGLSQHFDALEVPNLAWLMVKSKMGLKPQPPYRLHDMAADAIGVLDALGVDRAHVVGASMGGMIAQRVALAAPRRVRSLTSIMSTSGARDLPQADPKVLQALMTRPGGSQEAIVGHFMNVSQLIGSPGYPIDPAVQRERILAGLERSFHPSGTLRQMLAVFADTDRAEELHRITAPTLVLHGRQDPLVPFSGAEDTQKRIPGAKLVGIEGMGHDLPPGATAELLKALIPHLQGH
jgi:pimeloyl-ACP methyl ester carboxylesterase